ncbi:hypothetical protein H4219_004880 [Mycoemilia scoparia]|uniref:Swiss Army Knife RNA repair protein HAD domain-containing protein n=1 Tax=Mycoemilia scoparia TaxID=417184 RepID=A0A9W7ZZQ9_9FUNG|nr:hypothetical protein H4219_004880 [Mycoemilia scoparia]
MATNESTDVPSKRHLSSLTPGSRREISSTDSDSSTLITTASTPINVQHQKHRYHSHASSMTISPETTRFDNMNNNSNNRRDNGKFKSRSNNHQQGSSQKKSRKSYTEYVFKRYDPGPNAKPIPMPELRCNVDWNIDTSIISQEEIEDKLTDYTYRHRLRHLHKRWNLAEIATHYKEYSGNSNHPEHTTDKAHHGDIKTRLTVFDFDNTLFKSPMPNSNLWDSGLRGKLKSTDLGWFHDQRTLCPPYLDDSTNHWILHVLKRARQEISRSDTMTVLLTGRTYDTYDKRIRELLKSQNLNFDMIILKEVHKVPFSSNFTYGDDYDSSPSGNLDAYKEGYINPLTTKLPNTFLYKMQVLEDILDCVPTLEDIYMWDDRPYQCERMQQYLDTIRARNPDRINHTDVYYVSPETIYMPKELEIDIVHSMIQRYNTNLLEMAKSEGSLQPDSNTDQESELAPPGTIKIVTVKTNPKLELENSSQKQLASIMRSPKGWELVSTLVSVSPKTLPTREVVEKLGYKNGQSVNFVATKFAFVSKLVTIVHLYPKSGDKGINEGPSPSSSSGKRDLEVVNSDIDTALIDDGNAGNVADVVPDTYTTPASTPASSVSSSASSRRNSGTCQFDQDIDESATSFIPENSLCLIYASNPAVDIVFERLPSIRYWKQLYKPIELQGAIRETQVEGIEIVGSSDSSQKHGGSHQPPAAVSIGDLVMKYMPELNGPEVGRAVKFTKEIMEGSHIHNTEKCRDLIEEIVSKLDYSKFKM